VIGTVLLRPDSRVHATPSYRYAPTAAPAHWWVTEASRGSGSTKASADTDGRGSASTADATEAMIWDRTLVHDALADDAPVTETLEHEALLAESLLDVAPANDVAVDGTAGDEPPSDEAAGDEAAGDGVMGEGGPDDLLSAAAGGQSVVDASGRGSLIDSDNLTWRNSSDDDTDGGSGDSDVLADDTAIGDDDQVGSSEPVTDDDRSAG
jgi:hypothetical protein